MEGSVRNSLREPHSRGSPAGSRASESESKGLCSRFLLGHFIVILIFWGGFFGAVQLQDRSDPNLPDALLRVRLLALVLPAAQFALHLDMCAFGERLGEL